MDKVKEEIPKQLRIGYTCFTSLVTIGGDLFTRNPKNLTNVKRDSNDILSVIIILVIYVHGGKIVSYDGDKMNYIGKRSHVMKHSHRRCVFGSLGKNLHGGSNWTGYRAVLSVIPNKSIFLHFVHHGTRFYDKYIKSNDKKKYIDDDGSGVFP